MPRITKLVQFINSAAKKFEKPKENEFNILYINWSYSDYPSNGFLEAWSLLTNDMNGILTHPEIGKTLPLNSPVCNEAYDKITAIIVYTSSLNQLMYSDFRHSWMRSHVGPRFRMFVLDKNLREKELNDDSSLLFMMTRMKPSLPESNRLLYTYNSATENKSNFTVETTKFLDSALEIINENFLEI